MILPAIALALVAAAAVALRTPKPSRAELESQLREAEDTMRFYYRVLNRPTIPPLLREVAGFEYNRALKRVQALEKKINL